jgi:hypothetical protein
MARKSPSRISDPGTGTGETSVEDPPTDRASSRARSHRAGSFTRIRISTTSRLGITPNQKRTRHPAVWPKVVWGPTSRVPTR